MYSDFDMKARSVVCRLVCPEPTLAQQHMAEETNINTIVKRYGLTGTMPVPPRLPTYGDFTGVFDYQSALEALNDADKSFEALPADVRTKFGNDPGKFVDFCSNPANISELRELGLAPKLQASPSGLDGVQPAQGTAEPGAGGAV